MVKEFKYKVEEADATKRLDIYLASQIELNLTRSQVQRLNDKGYVLVNAKTVKASYKLDVADDVIITIPLPQKIEAKPENIPVDVVYEDGDLIVVNKARGMVVHPAVGNYDGTLVNALLYHCKDLSSIGGMVRPGIVHRLDKDTSGLIVVAKNDLAHQSLAKQFSGKSVLKQYLALVHGVIRADSGIIKKSIGRNPRNRKKMAVIEEGKESETHYKIIKRFKKYSLVELTLKSGRTHQIRVHLTSISHPVVGDPLYGHRKEFIKITGQLLHSAKMGFIHPGKNQYVEFTAPLPEDMQRIIKLL